MVESKLVLRGKKNTYMTLVTRYSYHLLDVEASIADTKELRYQGWIVVMQSSDGCSTVREGKIDPRGSFDQPFSLDIEGEFSSIPPSIYSNP